MSTQISAKYNKQKLSSEVLAEILRSDDEEELVEFLNKSFPTNGALLDSKRRFKTGEDDILQDVDLTTASTTTANGNISKYDLSSDSGSIIVADSSNNRLKLCLTLALFVSFFALGVAIAMLGPSLLDLGDQVKSSFHTMSSIFTIRSVGYLVGSLLAGWLLEKWSSYLVLSISCSIATVTLLIVPLTRSFYTLLFVVICQGLALGALDTGGNVVLLNLHGKNSEAQMQGLHAMFGLGAFVAPLLVGPFLKHHPATNIHYNNHTNISNISTTPFTTAQVSVEPDSSGIKWPFWISICFFLLPIIVFMFAVCKKVVVRKQNDDLKSWDSFQTPDWKSYRGFTLVLLFTFLLLYVGMEVAIGGLIFSFAFKHGILKSKTTSAYLTSLFWGSFCIGRFLAIPVAMYVRPLYVLVVDMVGCFVGALLLVCVSNSVPVLLWVGTGLLGVSMSSVFPSTMSWADTFMHITAKTASVLVVGAAVGEMTIPFAVGVLMANNGPNAFLQSILIIVILASVVFLTAVLLARRQKKQDIDKFGIHYRRADDVKHNQSIFSKGDEIVQLLEDSSEIFSADN